MYFCHALDIHIVFQISPLCKTYSVIIDFQFKSVELDDIEFKGWSIFQRAVNLWHLEANV